MANRFGKNGDLDLGAISEVARVELQRRATELGDLLLILLKEIKKDIEANAQNKYGSFL